MVQSPPYHYGADYITVYFKSDPERLQYFLPDKLKVSDGSAVAYVSDFVCTVSENDLDSPYIDPAQATYREAAIGIRCSYKGNPGVYYPFMWVDRDWSLVRGWTLGYSKKLADDIHLTRLHRLTPKVSQYGPGLKLAGYCARHGSRLISLSLEIVRKGTAKDIISSPSVYGWRYFPANAQGQNDVNELVEIQKGNSRFGDEIWFGDARLELGKSPNEELEKIDPIEPMYGVCYQFGFTNYGSKVLEQMKD